MAIRPTSMLILYHYISLSIITCSMTPLGTSIWYYYPQPGGILQNNVAISVHSTVNEVRCYSPDASSSNDNSVITPPSDPPGLSFISSGAGKLVKTGGTSIDGMDTGVYTCSYSNGGVASSVNFAVYPREREPGDTNEGMYM